LETKANTNHLTEIMLDVSNKSCYCSQQNYLGWNCRAFRPAMWKLRSDSI